MKKSIFRSRLLKIEELQSSLENFKIAIKCEVSHIQKTLRSAELIECYNSALQMRSDSIYTVVPQIIDLLIAEYFFMILLHEL